MSDFLHLTAFLWLCAGTLASLATWNLAVTLAVAAGFVALRVAARAAEIREERS